MNQETMVKPTEAVQFYGFKPERYGMDYLQNEELRSLLDMDKIEEDRLHGRLAHQTGRAMYRWEESPGEMYAEVMRLRLDLGREIDILDVKNICAGSFEGTDVGRAGFGESALTRYFNCNNPEAFRDTFNTVAKAKTKVSTQQRFAEHKHTRRICSSSSQPTCYGRSPRKCKHIT
jgi:hypothetical protein